MKEDIFLKQFPLESKLQEAVMKFLRAIPELTAVKISDRLNKGISDILICYKGRYIAIELKVGKNKPTAIQESFIKDIIASGGLGKVCYTLSDVREVLRQADEQADTYLQKG